MTKTKAVKFFDEIKSNYKWDSESWDSNGGPYTCHLIMDANRKAHSTYVELFADANHYVPIGFDNIATQNQRRARVAAIILFEEIVMEEKLYKEW